MVKLTEDFIFRLKSMCSITSIVSDYLNLKVSGRNMKCCCPFHSEKTPSFTVFEDTQSFYCFGCGLGGDVITFVERIDNVGYIEAVIRLAKKLGIELPEKDELDEKWKQKKDILNINKQAARFFYGNLSKPEGRAPLKYLLNSRQIKRETIVKFGLGFALNSWDSLKNHLLSLGYTIKILLESGLIIKSKSGKYYDRFRNRVIFPIIDLRGDVVGFGARIFGCEGGPKYLNSSDSLVFKKSLGLFALNFAKNSSANYFLLCEGYMDVIMLHQNGFDSAVASLGTSFTKEQARLLKRHRKDIVLAYDMDLAGSLGARRAINILEEVGIKPKILNLKGSKDPDEYIKKYGAAFFKNSVNSSTTIEKLKLNNLEKKYDVNDIDQKKKYINEYCYFLAELKDPLKKEIYLSELCSRFKLDRYVISNHINYIYNVKKKSFKQKLYKNKKYAYVDGELKNEKTPIKLVKAEEGVLRFLYYNQDKIESVKSLIDPSYFSSKVYKKIYYILIYNIEAKKNLDFTSFHEFLDSGEASLFYKIINDCKIYKNSEEEFFDYINLLKKQHYKKVKEKFKMSPQDLEYRRKELYKEKTIEKF